MNEEKNEDIFIENYPAENENDNREYKRLINIGKNTKEYNLKINKLSSQILRRIHSDDNEIYTGGEALYYIGLNNDGTIYPCQTEEYDFSVQILDKALKKINCFKKELSHRITNGTHIGEFLIREKRNIPIEITILMGGSVDAAKSTTIGCLISGEKDNGRGSSRASVLSGKDELRTGRTMSLSHHILGFNVLGEPCRNPNYRWKDVIAESSKIIKFIDLAGHEKYSKTTFKGYTLMKASMTFIHIGANMGVNDTTKEHISLCINLKIPFCFIVTKIDLCKNCENVMVKTLSDLKDIVSLSTIRKSLYNVNTDDDILFCAKNLYEMNIVPLFKSSNVTFIGIENIVKFLNILPLRKIQVKPQYGNTIEMYIDSTYEKKGFGCIIGGQILCGRVKINDILYIGPNKNGEYREVRVFSIHHNRVPVETTENNSYYYCLCIKGMKRYEVKKGMVATFPNRISFREFYANIFVNQISKKTDENTRNRSKSTTIRVGYEPTVHILNMRQNAKILGITNKKSRRVESDPDVLTYGDTGIVHFRFVYSPQYIKVDDDIILAEGILKCVGKIKSVVG